MMKAQQFFDEKLKPFLSQNPMCLSASEIKNQSVGVEVSGDGGGQWTLAFDGTGAAALREGVAEGGSVISTNDKTFSGMLDGSVNVPFAYLMRKIKIRGESGLAVKLGLALQKIFNA